jgi:hypothetical protein
MTHLLSCCGLGIATLAVPALVFNDTLMRPMPLGLFVISAVIATATIYLGRECLQLLQQDQP